MPPDPAVWRMRLSTDRLLLRPLTTADSAFVLQLVNGQDFLRFIGDRGVRTLTDAESYITEGPLASYGQRGFGLLLVERRTDGTPLGMCGLMQKPWLDCPDLAYAFLPEATGIGYAGEAARAVLDAAWHRIRLPRVLAVVTPDNERSIRLLAMLGFARQGTVLDPANTALELYAATA